ncbi:MAG: GGDEF domain-containing protein, partial [Gammaproteobacteria bacterium]|nr:GGDEF domain-containing protein [Gammaproteobacteria bacterium]
GYALVIYLLHLHHPQTFGLQLELFLLAGFAAALLGSALVGHEMYVLRLTLRERNRQVRVVLEQVKELAVTDELTGIHNRRYIVDVLERQAALAQRGDYRFSICFFDLDHFKQVNDTHGHAAGDRVLIKVAQIATEATRVGDYVARYGGEEFVIVLSATGVERALSVAERIRESAEGTSFDELGPDVRVTISCGVTEYRAPEAVHELLVRADEAMYAAKNRGRNTVVES